MKRALYYILRPDKIAVPVFDTLEWGRWFETAENRMVARTEFKHGVLSTIFLGLDHSFRDEGDPILFETMWFGPDGDEGGCWRHATWAEAKALHESLLAGYAKDEAEGEKATKAVLDFIKGHAT